MAPKYFFVNLAIEQKFPYTETEIPDFLFCGKKKLIDYVEDVTFDRFDDPEYNSRAYCLDIYGIGADGEICASYMVLCGELIQMEPTPTVDKLIQMGY